MADAQQPDTLLADLALPKLLLSCQASESVKLAAELFSQILLHQWHKNKIYSRLLSPSLLRQTCRRAQHIALSDD